MRWELQQGQTESVLVTRKVSDSTQARVSEVDREVGKVVSTKQSESLEIDVSASQTECAEVILGFPRGICGYH